MYVSDFGCKVEYPFKWKDNQLINFETNAVIGAIFWEIVPGDDGPAQTLWGYWIYNEETWLDRFWTDTTPAKPISKQSAKNWLEKAAIIKWQKQQSNAQT